MRTSKLDELSRQTASAFSEQVEQSPRLLAPAMLRTLPF
jgi:hypothetical protein